MQAGLNLDFPILSMWMFIWIWLIVQGEINPGCDPYSLNKAFKCQQGGSSLTIILKINPKKSANEQYLADCLTFSSIDDNQCLRSCNFEHDEKIGSSEIQIIYGPSK